MRMLLFVLFFWNAFAVADVLRLPLSETELPVVDIEKPVETENVSQEVKDQKIKQDVSPSVEKLQVTGSYIKRIQIEGPSPVVTLDSELFEQTGSQTLSDLLLESPLFSSSREFSGSYSFHGQGAESTLLLLNGLRIPKLGTPGRSTFNGVRSVAPGVIQRVEILKDGSSALYGSDASAGVMNIITKKDYDGSEFSYGARLPEIGAGRSSTYTASFGKNYSRSHWLTSIQYLEAQGYWQNDLGSFNQSQRFNDLASSGSFSRRDDQGRFQDVQWLGPTRTTDSGKIKPLKVSRLPFDQIKANRKNLSAFLTGGVDLSSQTKFSLLAIYNRHNRQTQDAPNNLVFDGTNIASLDLNQIQNSSLRELAGTLDSQSPELFLSDYTPLEEVGLRESRLQENAYNLQASLQKEFFETWNWQLETSLGFLTEEEEISRGIVDLEVARNQLYTGTWDPSLAVGSPQKQNSLVGAMVSPRYLYESQMITSKFVTSGEVFDFGKLWGAGGAVALAVGAETQNESFEDKNDDILTTGRLSVPRVTNLQGQRQVQSGFLELTAQPLDQLEFQAAGRFDQYSDVGSTFNPKLALAFRPAQSLLLRSSWGTSFRAPGIRSMALQPFDNWETFPDGVQCANGGSCDNDTLYKISRFRDPDLRPETSQHFNYGLMYQPNKSWTIGLDQWSFYGQDTLMQMYGSDVTQFEALTSNATLRSYGIDIQRDSNGALESITMPDRINMGRRTVRGVDLTIGYKNPVHIFGTAFKFSAKINHSQTIEKKSERFSGTIIDTEDGQAWRNIVILGLSRPRHSYRLASRTAAGGRIPTNPSSTFSVHTEYDFTYSYTFPWQGRFAFGVKNLFNTRPPFDFTSSTVRFDRPLRKSFDPLRRLFFTGYSQTF